MERMHDAQWMSTKAHLTNENNSNNVQLLHYKLPVVKTQKQWFALVLQLQK